MPTLPDETPDRSPDRRWATSRVPVPLHRALGRLLNQIERAALDAADEPDD